MIEDSLYRLQKVFEAIKKEIVILEIDDFDCDDLRSVTRRLESVIFELELEDKIRESKIEEEREEVDNGNTEEEL